MNGAVSAVPCSMTLWRTWFDKGCRAIDENDFDPAVAWLREALQHIQPVGTDERRYAQTQANLAWAMFKLAQGFEAHVHKLEIKYTGVVPECRLCRPPSPPQGIYLLPTREASLAMIAELRQGANAAAAAALPRLPGDGASAPLNLAAARAAQVLGTICREGREHHKARQFFELSIKFYQVASASAQLSEVDAVFIALFGVYYELCKFPEALAQVTNLEQRVRLRPGQEEWVAKLIACRADVHLQMGEYLQAADLADRWKRAVERCTWPETCNRDRAFGFAVLGKAMTLVGRFDEGATFLAQSDAISRLLNPQDLTLTFDIVIAQAEWYRRTGDLDTALRHLRDPRAARPVDSGRQVSLCSALGWLQLDRGDHAAARTSFQEAREIAEKFCGNRLSLVVPPLLGISRLDTLKNDWPAAVALAKRAIGCVEQSGEVGVEMGRGLHELSVALLQDDKSYESGPLAEAAERQYQMTLGSDAPELIDVLLTRAEYLFHRGQLEQARDVCATAISRLEATTPRRGFDRARALSLQGRILLAKRELVAARQYLECAEESWKQQETQDHVDHPEKSLIWLSTAELLVAEQRRVDADRRFGKLLPTLLRVKQSNSRGGYECNHRANMYRRLHCYQEALWLYAKARMLYARDFGGNHPYCQEIDRNVERAKRFHLVDPSRAPVPPSGNHWAPPFVTPPESLLPIPLEVPGLLPEARVEESQKQVSGLPPAANQHPVLSEMAPQLAWSGLTQDKLQPNEISHRSTHRRDMA